FTTPIPAPEAAGFAPASPAASPQIGGRGGPRASGDPPALVDVAAAVPLRELDRRSVDAGLGGEHTRFLRHALGIRPALECFGEHAPIQRDRALAARARGLI